MTYNVFGGTLNLAQFSAKTAEPIKMLFQLGEWSGAKESCMRIRRRPNPLWEGELWGFFVSTG